MNVFYPYLRGVLIQPQLNPFGNFESSHLFLHLLRTNRGCPRCKKATQLQPKDPPEYLAQESRMWSSPRTTRFPSTHMAPPSPLPSLWQPARRSTAPGSTKAWSSRWTQGPHKGRRATTVRFPWKWTVLSKPRLFSRKRLTPWWELFVVKTGEREPVTSSVGAQDEKCCCDENHVEVMRIMWDSE